MSILILQGIKQDVGHSTCFPASGKGIALSKASNGGSGKGRNGEKEAKLSIRKDVVLAVGAALWLVVFSRASFHPQAECIGSSKPNAESICTISSS